MSTKDFVDEYVYFDGNSTDGTPELLEYIRDKYQVNIKVVRDMDPKDLKDDYVRVFNECLKSVKSDHVFFLHPDMIATSWNCDLKKSVLSHYVSMRSFAGNPRGEILEIINGRTDKWKCILRNKFGLHYHGHYGVGNEDMYFKDITGNEYALYENFESYPYPIKYSGIKINHYSDVRDYKRRLGRMITSVGNQYPDADKKAIEDLAISHPRVSLFDSGKYNFKFKSTEDFPDVFYRKKPEEFCYLPLKETSINA